MSILVSETSQGTRLDPNRKLPTAAYAASAAKAPLGPVTIGRRVPRAHDVLIDIQYCGICNSDIHQARDEWGGSTFPMVPWHEITGGGSLVGSEVTEVTARYKLRV